MIGMKLKRLYIYGLAVLCVMLTLVLCDQKVEAEEIDKTTSLYKVVQATKDVPMIPDNYQYKDWRKVSAEFINMLFDFENYSLGYIDRSYQNTGRESLGFLTNASDAQDISQSQAITAIGALLSADLLGKETIGEEKLNQLVELVQSYYNVENGEGLFLNYQNVNTKDISFWEQVYPGLLYFMLMDRYEPSLDSEQILRGIADSWYDVVMDLGGNDNMVDMGYTGYDFKQDKPYDNGEWIEPDAAAGIALIQYYAYEKFQDRKYIKATELCMNYLDEFQRNPGYELLYLYLPYLSARLNALEKYHFDTPKYMEFFFTESDYRHEYGMFNSEFGTGLLGERTENGGTPYSFPSIVAATAVVPMLKYDQRYAVEVGRYLLQLTNSLNLFYDKNTSPLKEAYHNLIPAEKVERNRLDSEQELSVLGGSYLGLLGAMIEATNVEGILKVDLNVNDYYLHEEDTKPSYLIFNPYDQEQEVEYQVTTDGEVNLYDSVSQKFIEKNVTAQTKIKIKATDAVIITEIPVTPDENKYDEQRKVEEYVKGKVLASVNLIGLSQYEPISNDYAIDLEIKTSGDAGVSNIAIYLDGKPVFKNVSYTKPYVVDVSKLANGYHILEAEIETSLGTKDHSFARVFIQKDENPYLLNELPNQLIEWQPINGGKIEFIEGESAVRITGPVDGGIVSEPFELDFSQVPMISLEVSDFSTPWSLRLKIMETGETFDIFRDSTEAGHIISSVNYMLHKLNPKTFHLLGKHEVALELVTTQEAGSLDMEKIRLFNQGLQPLTEREWKRAFTTQKITHWQSRLNALGKVNYYEGTAVVKNLNKESSSGIQTGYFEVDLTKKPIFTINVAEVDELWSLLVYVEGDPRGYYLQYPTDKTGTFSYNIYDTLKAAYKSEDFSGKKNLQFWIISNGEYGTETKLEYLKMEYSKTWIELATVGIIVLLGVIAIFVNLNKEF